MTGHRFVRVASACASILVAVTFGLQADDSLSPSRVTDLKIEMIEEPGTLLVGESFERRITVENLGPFDAFDVRVSHDSRLEFFETVGCLNDPDGTPCELGSLPAGGRAVYLVRARLGTCGASPLTASVTVSSGVTDSEPSNDAVTLAIGEPCGEAPEGICDGDNDLFDGPQCAGPDCNDNNASIFPGAAEIVNDGVDQNCNGGDQCYQDLDNDNFGTAATVASADLDCADANEAPVAGDCNDNSAAIFPGALEIVGDGIDQDCNGGERCYVDVDNDNFGTASTINSSDLDCADANEGPVSGDCNDSNASVYPGAVEIINDGVDQNCNGGDQCYQDLDNDNFGTASTVASTDLDCADANEAPVSGDCNDTSASVFPGAVEIIGDGIDQDCNGVERCYQDLDDDNFGTATTINSSDLDCTDANEATVTGDCNDSSASVFPGAIEIVGDGVDQDCNGVERCYQDLDDDNFGTPSTINSSDLDCADANEAPVSTDCNDSNASVYPGAVEIINDGVDQNCNGGDQCYQDLDNDNFGTASTVASTDLDCADANEAPVSGDCNDSSASVFPGAIEIVGDGVDQDCNGGERCYVDVDDDNFGTPSTINSSDLDCADANEAPVSTDCNDSNASVYPGAVEIINDGVDQNCNGGDQCYQDLDNDNFGTASTVASTDLDCADANEAPVPGDCNDNSAAIFPGAVEIVGDGVDQDCNGGERCYQDLDDDNFGTAITINSSDLDCVDANEATVTGDCNDNNASAYPGAVEIVGDGVDQDCNGGERCYQDLDDDNYGTASTINSSDLDCADANEATVTGDCNDNNASAYPGAVEIVGDGVDQDCNGFERCYQDLDDDNFGTATTINSSDLDCADANEATVTGDCNDNNASTYPGAVEIVGDGVDQDCNGFERCYQDLDDDNYGTASTINSSDLDCVDANEATVTGDCNDSNASIYPGAPESCNSVDDDCDTVADDGFAAPSGAPVVTLAKVGGSTEIGWSAISSVTGYDVVRGNLGLLRSTGGDFTAATSTCLGNQNVATSISDGAVPALSAGFSYLVRGTNCLSPGTYDVGPGQIGVRDAEIAASLNACP